MELASALILGMVGSLHCAAMCGPLMLALPRANGPAPQFVLGRIAYHFGRIGTYAALGLVFGFVGKVLWLAGIQRWLSIALGVALLVGLFGSRKWRPSRPVFSFVHRLKGRMSTLLQRRSIGSLVALGALNGLLPCGLVYVAAAGATATDGIVAGVTYMAAFGAGTVPTLLAISFSGRLIPVPVRLKLQRAIPVSIFLLGLLLLARGLSLGIPYISPDLAGGACCHK